MSDMMAVSVYMRTHYTAGCRPFPLLLPGAVWLIEDPSSLDHSSSQRVAILRRLHTRIAANCQKVAARIAVEQVIHVVMPYMTESTRSAERQCISSNSNLLATVANRISYQL